MNENDIFYYLSMLINIHASKTVSK